MRSIFGRRPPSYGLVVSFRSVCGQLSDGERFRDVCLEEAERIFREGGLVLNVASEYSVPGGLVLLWLHFALAKLRVEREYHPSDLERKMNWG